MPVKAYGPVLDPFADPGAGPTPTAPPTPAVEVADPWAVEIARYEAAGADERQLGDLRAWLSDQTATGDEQTQQDIRDNIAGTSDADLRGALDSERTAHEGAAGLHADPADTATPEPVVEAEQSPESPADAETHTDADGDVPFDVTTALIKDVEQAVTEGKISAGDALAAEQARGDKTRSTLVAYLQNVLNGQ